MERFALDCNRIRLERSPSFSAREIWGAAWGTGLRKKSPAISPGLGS
jgi:hypothetical protein